MPAEEISVDEALPVRHAVLRDGKAHLTAAFPEDDREGCFHVGLRDEHGAVVATSTYMPEPTLWRPGRRAWRLRGMAVAHHLQGTGVGRTVLAGGVEALRRRGAEVLWANAHDSALGFYERAGMKTLGEQFSEGPAALPHHVVLLDLEAPPVRLVEPPAGVTERLDLVPWRRDDLDDFARLMAIPEVTRYPWGEPFTRLRSQEGLAGIVGHWDRLGWGLWKAVDRRSGQVCGWVGLATPAFLPAVMPAVEVGWRFDPAFWGQGLATQAGAVALDHGFSALGLQEIVSIYESPNEKSGAVMRRLGMEHLRDVPDPVDGRPLHIYVKRAPA